MDIHEGGPDYIAFRHNGAKTSGQLAKLVIAIVVLGLALAVAMGAMSLLNTVVLIAVAGAFLWLIRRSEAQSIAVFDKENKQFELVHRLVGGTEERVRGALSEVEAVILDVAVGKTSTNSLQTRPAVVLRGEVVPLTKFDFAADAEAREVALKIRRFLGHKEKTLVDESIKALARLTPRTQPAVRLARLAKGLSRVEAATLVSELKK